LFTVRVAADVVGHQFLHQELRPALTCAEVAFWQISRCGADRRGVSGVPFGQIAGEA
jgi:hypothetical protein